MKAAVIQQRSLLELAEIDAELSRIAHRAGHLPEQGQLERVQNDHRGANVAKFETEIDAVRQREDRDRSLLDAGAINAKQLAELQHELDTLERRQSNLEDSLLEVMERREELQRQQSDELAHIDELQNELSSVQKSREQALTEIEQTRHQCVSRRDELMSELDAELVALYERQRSLGGAGAGVLQGRRCGACRIEIDRGELARISAAADDDVRRCPECGAILLRVKDFDR